MNILLAIAATSALTSAAPLKPTVKPVLIVLTSHAEKGNTGEATGFYLSEVTHPLAVFQAANIPVEFASIQGGAAPVDGLDLTDAINARYWQDQSFKAQLASTQKLQAIDSAKYSAVFFAGGHGTMWDFPDSPAVQRVAREVYEAQGVVAAVCHGPAALVNVRLSDGKYLVEGKEVSAFTDAEEQAVKLDAVVPFLLSATLAKRGAILRGAANWQAQVSVSARLVTGQNPASATGVAQAMVQLLQSAAIAQKANQ
jgi:putative intracellular protease/amidase